MIHSAVQYICTLILSERSEMLQTADYGKQPTKMHRVIEKSSHQAFVITLSNTDEFLHYFNDTFSSKLPVKLSLKIPSHLKCFDTLACEIIIFKNRTERRHAF